MCRKSVKDLFREDIKTNKIVEESEPFTAPTFTYLENTLPSSKIQMNLQTVPNPKKVASEADLYEDNSGTSLVVTAENKIIIASDTRHSSEYTINSRKMTKIYKIGEFFLVTTGFFPDGFELFTKLSYEVKQYETYHRISLKALAHLLHNILYTRRFFPYYSYACLCGFIDGVASIYSYDPVGSYDMTKCRCNGSASKMIQPLLDSWIMGKNFKNFKALTFEETVELVKKAFDGAAERDVKTKDFLELYILEEGSVKHEFIQLRHD